MAQKFKITKTSMEAYVNNGFTVAAMAADITAKSGEKCTEAIVKNACKTYGINLLKKKKPTNFVFDDMDATTPVAVGNTVESKTNSNTIVQAEAPQLQNTETNDNTPASEGKELTEEQTVRI